ncbi:uncharacterized protein [Zea mays]|uniref:Uncharacterized protein n=1 Tax=Zea mays TaxID=4577 RepID=A0A804LM88_MAIZE|nr:uncharacterized protein LOC109943430 [Zea mays]
MATVAQLDRSASPSLFPCELDSCSPMEFAQLPAPVTSARRPALYALLVPAHAPRFPPSSLAVDSFCASSPALRCPSLASAHSSAAPCSSRSPIGRYTLASARSVGAHCLLCPWCALTSTSLLAGVFPAVDLLVCRVRLPDVPRCPSPCARSVSSRGFVLAWPLSWMCRSSVGACSRWILDIELGLEKTVLFRASLIRCSTECPTGR